MKAVKYIVLLVFIGVIAIDAKARSIISYNISCSTCAPQSASRDLEIIGAIKSKNPDVIGFQELSINSEQESRIISHLTNYKYCRGAEGGWRDISTGIFIKKTLQSSCGETVSINGSHTCSSATIAGEFYLNCHLTWREESSFQAWQDTKQLLPEKYYLLGDLNFGESQNQNTYNEFKSDVEYFNVDRVDYISSNHRKFLKFDVLGDFQSNHNMIFASTFGASFIPNIINLIYSDEN